MEANTPRFIKYGKTGGRIKAWFVGLLFFAMTLADAVGQENGESLVLDEIDLIQFSDRLFLEREYYRAITEYKRYLFYFPNGEHTEHSKIQIGNAYLKGEDYEGAVHYWKSLLEEIGLNPEMRDNANIGLVLGLLNLQKEKPFPFRLESVKEALGQINDFDVVNFRNRNYVEFAEDYLSDNDPEDEKSPYLAGGLSLLVPGMGSVYNKRYVESLYVFFFTGIFAYAAYTSKTGKDPELYPFFAFISVSFYFGGVYAAVNGSHRYNSNEQVKRLNRMRTKYDIY